MKKNDITIDDVINKNITLEEYLNKTGVNPIALKDSISELKISLEEITGDEMEAPSVMLRDIIKKDKDVFDKFYEMSNDIMPKSFFKHSQSLANYSNAVRHAIETYNNITKGETININIEHKIKMLEKEYSDLIKYILSHSSENTKKEIIQLMNKFYGENNE